VLKALEQTVSRELTKSHPKIPLTFHRSPPTPSQNCGIGILLYAETTHFHRIAASTMLEIPTRLQPGTLPKQEVKARERGIEVVRRLVKQIGFGGVVDEYLADQIVIFMALGTSGANPPVEQGEVNRVQVVEGNGDGSQGEGARRGKRRRSELLVGEVSLHTETAMRIAEIMLGNIVFSTEKVEGGSLIICERKDA
jgi:RNA 3'-terminal phosphate cyclase